MNKNNTSLWDVPSSLDTSEARGRRRATGLLLALVLGSGIAYNRSPSFQNRIDGLFHHTLCRLYTLVSDMKTPIDGPKIPQP